MYLYVTAFGSLGIYYYLFSKGRLPKPAARIAGYLFNWTTIPLICIFNAIIKKRFPSEIDDTVILVDTVSKQDVRAVINMCDEYSGPVQTYRAFGIRQLKLPTVDHTEPELADIESAIRFIEEQKSQGARVYLHCRSGRGRSGAVAFCWLAKQNPGLSPQQVQERLLQLRPMVRKKLFQQPNVKKYLETLKPPF